jgi:hypothetical protein
LARLEPQENREDMRMFRRMLGLDAWKRWGPGLQEQDMAPSRKRRSSREHSAPGTDPTTTPTEFKEPELEELPVMIRELAVDAHRALKNPLVTAAEMSDLSRRIDALRKAARSACLSEIDRWLQQVQRRVDERRQTARLTTRA